MGTYLIINPDGTIMGYIMRDGWFFAAIWRDVHAPLASLAIMVGDEQVPGLQCLDASKGEPVQ